jgi:hypothetical protein
MKRRTGCCAEIVKDIYNKDAGARTSSLGDKLFDTCGVNACAPVNPYLGKSYGCGDDKCGTVKKVAVAQDYNERIRRLKSGSDQ